MWAVFPFWFMTRSESVLAWQACVGCWRLTPSGTFGILVLFSSRDCQRSALGHTHAHASRPTNHLSISQSISHQTLCQNKKVGAARTFISLEWHHRHVPGKWLSQLIVSFMVRMLLLDANCCCLNLENPEREPAFARRFNRAWPPTIPDDLATLQMLGEGSAAILRLTPRIT